VNVSLTSSRGAAETSKTFLESDVLRVSDSDNAEIVCGFAGGRVERVTAFNLTWNGSQLGSVDARFYNDVNAIIHSMHYTLNGSVIHCGVVVTNVTNAAKVTNATNVTNGECNSIALTVVFNESMYSCGV
jgi:hypothetical protein